MITSTTLEAKFPADTTVRIKQVVSKRAGDYESTVVGKVVAWENTATGSWYAHGKNDKYWLGRLRLKKADGEITYVVIDRETQIEAV